MTLEIDMRNPAVRNLLGADEPGVARPGAKRQMVQLAGDPGRGLVSTTRLDTGKHETLVLFRGRSGDFVLTVDVYAIPGEPLQIHFICPRCHKQGRITEEAKAISWSPTEQRVLELPDGQRTRTGGLLSVEAFECTWELGNEAHTPGIRAGGLTLCRQRMVIDHNVARDI